MIDREHADFAPAAIFAAIFVGFVSLAAGYWTHAIVHPMPLSFAERWPQASIATFDAETSKLLSDRYRV